MIQIDEGDLIAFFLIEPESQDSEEKEFFEAPLFIKTVNDLTLEFSFSFHHKDLFVDLSKLSLSEKILTYSVKEIESIEIAKDKDGIEWLSVLSKSRQRIRLSVNPQIQISISTTA